MSRSTFADTYLRSLTACLAGLDRQAIVEILERPEKAWTEGATIFLAGNGGSAATASHMATDLAKTVAGMDGAGQGFRTIALTDNVPMLTAWANDVGYEEVFAGQLRALAKSGDLLILISGSGNSRNLLRAARAAKELGLTTIGLLGKGGGQLKAMVDITAVVPSDDYGPIEDAHLAINLLFTAYFKQWTKASAYAKTSSDTG